MSDRINRLDAIVELHRMQGNLTYLDPDQLMANFVDRMGPDWHKYVLIAFFETIKVQNEQIMELKKVVMTELDSIRRGCPLE
jgi:hypothetical protein